MKTSALLFPFLLSAFPLTSQSFTPPDSAAIVKSHVRSVKIFYDGTGSKHDFTKEFRYDEKGRCIYEQEGSANFYYSHQYNEKNQIWRSVQRETGGKFIQAFETDFYSSGKQYRVKAFYNNDSINPAWIYAYDERGNRTEEYSYLHGTLTRVRKMNYNNTGDCIYSLDSMPGHFTQERNNGRLIRESRYDEQNKLKETWLFTYDTKGLLLTSTCKRPEKKDELYTFTYDQFGYMQSIKLNGKDPSAEQETAWKNRWDYLLPRPREEDFSDPFVEPAYTHQLKRDKNGNITEDRVLPAIQQYGNEGVVFTYEYTYYQ